MTKDTNNIGGDETFYMHCLKFYMPMITEVTLDGYKMGLGIFIMQGFEKRSKQLNHQTGSLSVKGILCFYRQWCLQYNLVSLCQVYVRDKAEC